MHIMVRQCTYILFIWFIVILYCWLFFYYVYLCVYFVTI